MSEDPRYTKSSSHDYKLLRASSSGLILHEKVPLLRFLTSEKILSSQNFVISDRLPFIVYEN